MIVTVNYEKKKYKTALDYKEIVNNLRNYYKKRLSYKHSYETINLNYNIVSRKKQVEINRNYLNHNYNTDIISFNLSIDSDTLIGDIYISIKRVRKNATKYREGIYQEMNRNFIHGFLHLLGNDDKNKSDRKIMKKEEAKYLEFIKD